MFESIDLYCERLSPAFLAEPVNAASNVAFVVAGWFAWRLAKRISTPSPGILLLVSLMWAVGIGSGVFHTFATGWAMVLDLGPIVLFQLIYLWIYCRRIVEMGIGAAIGVQALYIAAIIASSQAVHLFNGSLLYAPAFVLLFVLGIYHVATYRFMRYSILSAAAVFVVSLGLRTMDAGLCDAFPTGTHFMWHLGSAMVIYLLMRGLLTNVVPILPGLLGEGAVACRR